MSTESPAKACVTQRFNVSPDRVFAAWLDPEMLGQWMFGPRVREEEIVSLTVDACVGGKFSFIVNRFEEELDHVGEYLEIERPRRLAFTWSVKPSTDNSRVIIDIKPVDSGAELSLTHELHSDWADYVNPTEEAWTKMLKALQEAFS